MMADGEKILAHLARKLGDGRYKSTRDEKLVCIIRILSFENGIRNLSPHLILLREAFNSLSPELVNYYFVKF